MTAMWDKEKAIMVRVWFSVHSSIFGSCSTSLSLYKCFYIAKIRSLSKVSSLYVEPISFTRVWPQSQASSVGTPGSAPNAVRSPPRSKCGLPGVARGNVWASGCNTRQAGWGMASTTPGRPAIKQPYIQQWFHAVISSLYTHLFLR